jgi:hypothetical protein
VERIPAIVAAGDRGAARPVLGRAKAYLELGGSPMVRRVVATLQAVPEVSEVWVVGDAERLAAALAPLAGELRKPLHVVPQFRNLYENCWETYRRVLSAGEPGGRDPKTEADLDLRILYLSADIPFATEEELSHFVRLALGLDCDYALGLSTEASMLPFYPRARGEPGIRMAYFNVREGRFRQNNLHLVRPGRLRHRFYIQEMYEHRHQRNFVEIVGLAWRLLRSQEGGLRTLGYYLLLQAAAFADRWLGRRAADALRRLIRISRFEQGISSLLGCRFRFAIADLGGCAVDIDNERDYQAAQARFEEWSREQRERARSVRGALELPAGCPEARLRVLSEPR